MPKVEIVKNIEEFLDHTQIVSLLRDQMEYIGSPKTNDELLKTIKLALKSESTYLIVVCEDDNTLGFAFFNVCIGMESAGKYLWLNEMHIHQDYRSQGYGAILFEGMKQWCIENDVKRIMGMAHATEVRTLNFYKKQGADLYENHIISLKL